MTNATTIIQQRISVRTYSDRPAGDGPIAEVLAHADSLGPGPFGNRVRFGLIDASAFSPAQLRAFGTYGMISGARHYLTGAMKPAPRASEDFGWLMEEVILKATSLGLGSCWLGGTLDRAVFGSHICLAEDEFLPAASPLGWPPARQTVKDRMIRGLVKADRRQPFARLFFDGSPAAPLDEERAGVWLDALLAVRQAPSASNKQPWRIIRDPAGRQDGWHFFLDEDPPYNRRFAPALMQNIDMGIALRHFAAVAAEQGLPGRVQVLAASEVPAAGAWTYIASWY